MSVPEDANRLDETNVQLGKELWLIHSSRPVYRVIGLNAEAIPRAKRFSGSIQNLSLSAVALGLAKVFEREQPSGYKLCSLRGVFRLAKAVQIEDGGAAEAFVRRYGVAPSADWDHDVDQVFTLQRPRIKKHMAVIDRVRNTRLAHTQQMAPETSLPSIAAFEELLTFAFDFHSFVNEAFLNIHPHPTLTDKQVEGSLLRVLEMVGVTDPQSQFTDI